MEKEMETDDLTLACFLRVEGVHMIRTFKAGHRIWFVFSNDGGRANRLADAFYNSRDGKRAHDLIKQYRLVRGLALDMRDGGIVNDILYEQEQYSEMHPALDISNGCLYVAVQVNTKTGAQPYLLKSTGDGTVEATPYEGANLSGKVLKTQGLDLSYATPPIRWLGDGLRRAIEEQTVDAPDFPAVFRAVRDTLSSYLVAEEQHITVSALFILMTYFHPLMDHLPVLWCRAVQGAGKSRLAEAIGLLSFNGMVSGTSTRSTVFRSADAGRYTQALTEMDRLAGTATFILGQAVGPHLSPLGSLIFSLTSFHGRGFFPGAISPDDPITALAALEAVLGLLIEATFIAGFTQRLFGR